MQRARLDQAEAPEVTAMPTHKTRATVNCKRCGDTEWVCENHNDKPWPDVCDCGAGAPCPNCNELASEYAKAMVLHEAHHQKWAEVLINAALGRSLGKASRQNTSRRGPRAEPRR